MQVSLLLTGLHDEEVQGGNLQAVGGDRKDLSGQRTMEEAVTRAGQERRQKHQ